MIYLVRYAEIALKGKNRKDFENKLVENMKACARNSGFEIKIRQLQGRFLVSCDQHVDFRNVFGVVSFSPCTRIELEFEAICSEVLKIAEKHSKTTTFRISAKKLTKDFDLSSMELNSKVGAFIAEKTGFKVKLDNPDLDLGIELVGKEAFVFDKTIACFGGLPIGIEGKVLILISNEKSLLAALLMMKRGCAIEVAGFSEVSVQELSLLQAFYPYKLVFHKVNDASELDKLALSLGCKAFVVGDTINDMPVYPINIMILRPLVAFSDSEIKAEMDKFRKASFE
jgi:thiamine biosynthesis protein ThiI